MRTLTSQLQGMIAEYLDERIPLAELRGWLEEHVGALDGADDLAFVPFAGRVWLWLSEFDLGDRSELDVRERLDGWLRDADSDPAGTAGSGVRAM